MIRFLNGSVFLYITCVTLCYTTILSQEKYRDILNLRHLKNESFIASSNKTHTPSNLVITNNDTLMRTANESFASSVKLDNASTHSFNDSIQDQRNATKRLHINTDGSVLTNNFSSNSFMNNDTNNTVKRNNESNNNSAIHSSKNQLDNLLRTISNDPIISDPVPIKYYKQLSPATTLSPVSPQLFLAENTIEPVPINITRYKNESSLILNRTITNFSSDPLDKHVENTFIGPDVSFALITNLQQNVLDLWTYKDYIKSPSDLMLDQGLIDRARISLSSGKRLRKFFERGVKGQNVHTALISSSVSRTFLKDPTSKKWLYPNALVNWWRKVVTPITRSQIDLQDVSIAGVGSDYFSRCLKSHLQDNGETDLILWELSGSDYKPGGRLKTVQAESMERLLRSALEYKSTPDVVLLNFFRGDHLNKSAYCRELDEAKEATLASHYDCTALSWSKSICPYLSDDEEGFSFSYLFSRDQTHPSIIGHAQMAYILIDYVRDEFLKFLQEYRYNNFFRKTIVSPLPNALYSQDYKTLCYSSLKAVDDPPDDENSNLPVIFIAPEPYDDAAHRSHIAKYLYKPSVKTIIIRFTIVNQNKHMHNRVISIMPYFSKPVRTMVRVDNHEFTELKIKKYNKGKMIKIQPAMLLAGGDHMLRIWSLDEKFKVLTLTVDEV